MEKAEPQTIEHTDGFPLSNRKFCGGAQEVMAVIQNNKPVAMTDFNETEFRPMMYSWKEKGTEKRELADCKQYTYKDVYNASKKVDLCVVKGKFVNYYFLKEHMQEAYLLDLLQDDDTFSEKANLNYKESNILIGIFLGYKKKDIRAWFLMELRQLFSMDFDDIDQRKKFIQRSDFQEIRDCLAKQFEVSWKSANKKLNQIKKDFPVPSSWAKKCKSLPPLKKGTRKNKKN